MSPPEGEPIALQLVTYSFLCLLFGRPENFSNFINLAD